MPSNDLRKGRVSLPGAVYHVTAVTHERKAFFASLETGRCVVRELMALQTAGHCRTLCYVLMPDHLHWLMTPCAVTTLAQAVHLLKGRSARVIGHHVWQPGYHDHAMRRDENLRTTARYIVANPLRAGLVRRLGDYSLWDAMWLP